eukprot:TRINITY_DN3525_c0_g1_i2.p1 TRINITY_DN3525_c0_g1~~TRINITY_DN3525_c0_g1_i2.p1  ORF type:complete len:211 (-),score=29.64 TRINITY_DN3525_c0_g1_i2:51-683(-)
MRNTTYTFEEFVQNMEELITKQTQYNQDSINDLAICWEYHKCETYTHLPGYHYLSYDRPFAISKRKDDEEYSFNESDDIDLILEESDECASYIEPHITDKQYRLYRYHILYSKVFNVPTLYFNVFDKDGQLLTLEQVWEELPLQYKNDNKWTFITQVDHPIEGMPYFQIHPCNTMKFMEKMTTNPSNFLLSWLSVYGPIVGLHMPLYFYK